MFDDVGLSDLHSQGLLRYYRDAQNKPFWRGKTGPAHTLLIEPAHFTPVTIMISIMDSIMMKPLHAVSKLARIVQSNRIISRAVFRVSNAGVQAKVHKLGATVMGVMGGEHDVVWVDVSVQNHAAGST